MQVFSNFYTTLQINTPKHSHTSVDWPRGLGRYRGSTVMSQPYGITHGATDTHGEFTESDHGTNVESRNPFSSSSFFILKHGTIFYFTIILLCSMLRRNHVLCLTFYEIRSFSIYLLFVCISYLRLVEHI